MIRKVEPYSILSLYYDQIIGTDHERTAQWMIKLLEKLNIFSGSCLEFGCGTGEFSRVFHKLSGMNVLGLDPSAGMIRTAKNGGLLTGVSFRKGDLQTYTAGEKYDCAFMLGTGINHILTQKELQRSFRNVAKCLKPDGWFIFDLSSEINYNESFADKDFIYDLSDGTQCLMNGGALKKGKAELLLDFFNPDKGTLQRETHCFRFFSPLKIRSILEKCFFLVREFEGYTLRTPRSGSRIIVYAGKLSGKQTNLFSGL